MKRCLLFAVFCTLTLPLLYSSSPTGVRSRWTPISGIVLAGHSQIGGTYCPCDPVDGVCPCCGETVARITASSPTDLGGDSLTKGYPVSNPETEPSSDYDFGGAALWFGLGLLIWRYASNSVF